MVVGVDRSGGMLRVFLGVRLVTMAIIGVVAISFLVNWALIRIDFTRAIFLIRRIT